MPCEISEEYCTSPQIEKGRIEGHQKQALYCGVKKIKKNKKDLKKGLSNRRGYDIIILGHQ